MLLSSIFKTSSCRTQRHRVLKCRGSPPFQQSTNRARFISCQVGRGADSITCCCPHSPAGRCSLCKHAQVQTLHQPTVRRWQQSRLHRRSSGCEFNRGRRCLLGVFPAHMCFTPGQPRSAGCSSPSKNSGGIYESPIRQHLSFILWRHFSQNLQKM